ncbi:MAG: hypothetical protein H7Y09_10390, partial [Chitinophagaceae bacterium]|nr:hypothetical protein [Anaerolineae bacterium]
NEAIARVRRTTDSIPVIIATTTGESRKADIESPKLPLKTAELPITSQVLSQDEDNTPLTEVPRLRRVGETREMPTQTNVNGQTGTHEAPKKPDEPSAQPKEEGEAKNDISS